MSASTNGVMLHGGTHGYFPDFEQIETGFVV
jgi:hypothetical protein